MIRKYGQWLIDHNCRWVLHTIVVVYAALALIPVSTYAAFCAFIDTVALMFHDTKAVMDKVNEAKTSQKIMVDKLAHYNEDNYDV